MPDQIIKGHAVHYARRDGDGPFWLGLHCSLASSAAWNEVIERSDPSWQFVNPDMPGHGETAYDPARRLIDQAVETAATLIEQHGAPAHIAGHSFGGVTALGLALERPDLVKSLVLYEPVLFRLLNDVDHPGWPAEKALNVELNAAFSKNHTEAARVFLSRWGQGGGLDDLKPHHKAHIIERIHLIAIANETLMGDDPEGLSADRLADIKVPVHVLAGAQTPDVIHQINDIICEQIPHAHRDLVEGAGHMGPMTHPSAMVAAMKGMVSGR